MKMSSLVQFVKFGLVGVSNTAVDWIVFYILINFAFPSQHSVAKAISFTVAVLNSYLWNTVWTFKKEYQKAGKGASDKSAIFVKFVVVSLLGWGLNVLVFSWAVKSIKFQLFNKPDLLPLILASGAAVLLNFFGNKLWTFQKSGKK